MAKIEVFLVLCLGFLVCSLGFKLRENEREDYQENEERKYTTSFSFTGQLSTIDSPKYYYYVESKRMVERTEVTVTIFLEARYQKKTHNFSGTLEELD